jgi:Tat protein secretion system quality control protein TatD with DNase activity
MLVPLASRYALKRLTVETDWPVGYQGKKSEPSDLVITLRESSHIKNLPPDELACVTSANTEFSYRQFVV